MSNRTDYATLVDLLRERANAEPERIAYTFLADGETESGRLSYGELHQQARAIAAQIQALVPAGERALLVYPYSNGLEFIGAFFGCLCAGVVAVANNPPRHRKFLAELSERAIACQASIILSTSSLLEQLKGQITANPGSAPLLAKLPWIATDTVPLAAADNWREPNLNSDTIAYFQYSSGSTGKPKGVTITHGNVLHNSAVIWRCFEHSSESRGLLWLPLFHDMGLVGGVVHPLHAGFTMSLMSPVTLIQKPACWLEAIARYRVTTSGGPNFAYDLACYKVTPQQRENLDLSSWDVAFSGAEPVRAETLARFAATFAPCGFRPHAFYPCYGMAETTLFISGGAKAAEPLVKYVDEAVLQQNRVLTVDAGAESGRAIVSCGKTWLGDEVIIVDPESLTECQGDQVGEIWVAGAGIGKGYWREPEETEQTFRAYLADTGAGPYLRTGDLGFAQDGELFITGRLKELMIFWGRNHYPQYIELSAQKSHPALRLNGGAAFAIEAHGEERLIIAQEVERRYLRNLPVEEIFGAIRQAIAEEHIVDVYAILLLKPGSLPKTSSGKIQRRACRAKFLDGSFEAVASWQNQQTSILEMLNRS